MIEYLRQDNNPLTITYTASSYATNVFFEIYDLDTEEFVQGGAGVNTGSYTYNITLNTDSTAYDRNIKIEYVTTATDGAYGEVQYASLMRPYATPARIRQLADIDSSVTDETLTKLEKKARLFINGYLGMNFYKEKRSIVAYGNNTDILNLPDFAVRVDEIYEDDLKIYQYDSSTYELEYPIEITDSKNRIKIVNSPEKNTEIMEFPKFSVFYYEGVFKKDYSYRLEGIFGWEYIPADVEMATALIVEDYLCNDFNVRNKNIGQLSNDSYEIKYGGDFATGTGNLLVDNLLSYYRQPRFLVI